VARERTFSRGEVFPSYIVNTVLDSIGSIAQSFRLSLASATSVQVVAGAGDETAVLAIDGVLRFRTSTVTRAHPGGAAASFNVYATAAAQNVVNTPDPNTDATVRTFDLAITLGVATPTIVPGTVDVFRLVGTGVWNGSAITSLSPLVHEHRATDPVRATAQAAAQTPLTGIATGGQTANLLTLASSDGTTALFRVSSGGAALSALDITARDALTAQARIGAFGPASEAALSLGSTGDAVLYRSAADTLASADLLTLTKTGQSLLTSGYVDAAPAVSTDVAFRARIPGDSVPRLAIDAAGKMSWGAGGAAAADVTLFRSGAGVLQTDQSLYAAGAFTAGLGSSGQIYIPGSFSGTPTIFFGTALDTNFYRSAAGTLKTDGALQVTGILTAPTAAPGTNSTQVATTAFVQSSGANAFSQTIGDGFSTTIDVTHNLGTRALAAAVQSTVAPYQEVYPRVEYPTVNVMRLIFDVPPTAGAYVATIFGKGAAAQTVIAHASTHNPGGADSLNYAAIATTLGIDDMNTLIWTGGL
jgi:hypothetical protein